LLLLSTVTAAVLGWAFSVTEPPVAIVTSDAAPLFAVEVFTGAVVAVEMVTWAVAGRQNTNGAAAPSRSRTLKDMTDVYS
jgi:hypothetical protein